MTPGLRVVDLGVGLPTAVVARCLADLGATVVRASGDEAFLAAAYPAYAGTGAPWTRAAPDALPALLAAADVCLVGGEDHPDHPPVLDAATVRARHPHLVVLEISGFVPGMPHPPPAVELLAQASTGLCFEQFSDRPVCFAFSPGLYGSALLGLVGVWAALLERCRTGTGALVTTSLQQGLAQFWSHLWLTAERGPGGVDTGTTGTGATDSPALDTRALDTRALDTRAFDTVPPRDVRHLIFRCAGGDHIQIVLGVPGATATLHAVLGIPGPVDPADRGTPDPARGPDGYFADRARLAPWFARRDRDELLAAFAVAGLPAGPVLAPGQCFDDEQVRAEGLVRRDADGREHVGSPLRLRPAGPPAPPRPPDLSRLRVVDLGNWVAGPLASRILADLGADVIKVEPPDGLSHLTGVRNVWVCNRGKRRIVVDLRSPEGLDVVRALVREADVVLHNFRPGVAERLGVDAASLRRIRPDLVYLHTSAYGTTGPRARHSGFDMIMQAWAGHEVRAGGAGNEPLWYRSPIVDYATGLLGAAGLLAALHRRALDGRGVDVGVSLLGAALFLQGSGVRTADGRVEGLPLLTADRTGFHRAEALHATRDGWVAVAARGPVASGALARLAGTIGRWSTADALAALAAAGVPAVECRDGGFARLLADPAARAAGLVASVPDAELGRVTGCFGPLVRLGSAPAGPPRPARTSGADTRAVLLEHGYRDDRVDALLRAGVVRESYRPKTAPRTSTTSASSSS